MEKWYKFEWSKQWWHLDFQFLWSNWAVGVLLDSGRRWGGFGQSPEKGIMLLLPCLVIRLFWANRNEKK